MILGDYFIYLQPGDEPRDHVLVCRTWETSFLCPKPPSCLLQETLQKSKQSHPGKAAVLLQPHISNKGLPHLRPTFIPDLNEAQTKRNCQWSSSRAGLGREMKTCRRLQPNGLAVFKQGGKEPHFFQVAF